jgi:hypothetical protein
MSKACLLVLLENIKCYDKILQVLFIESETQRGRQPETRERNVMRRRPYPRVLVWLALGLLIAGAAPARAADPEIDRLLQSPVARDWVTNGGNLTNQRYSTLKRINTTNVKQLNGAWRTRLKRSGFGTKYSAEATPLVKDGIMYMVTGNDDVFALNGKTGDILWQPGRRQARAVVGSAGGWQWAKACCSSASWTPMSWRSICRPAERYGGPRSRIGATRV